MSFFEETKTFISLSKRYAVWDVNFFSDVVSNELRKKRLSGTRNIECLIKKGKLAPIINSLPTVGFSDRAATIKFRIALDSNPLKLKRKEELYLVDSSQSYLLASSGFIALSAFEDIYNFVMNASSCIVPVGYYECRIHKIDSLAERESHEYSKIRNTSLLPDLIVHLSPVDKTEQTSFRHKRNTFDPCFPEEQP